MAALNHVGEVATTHPWRMRVQAFNVDVEKADCVICRLALFGWSKNETSSAIQESITVDPCRARTGMAGGADQIETWLVLARCAYRIKDELDSPVNQTR